MPKTNPLFALNQACSPRYWSKLAYSRGINITQKVFRLRLDGSIDKFSIFNDRLFWKTFLHLSLCPEIAWKLTTMISSKTKFYQFLVYGSISKRKLKMFRNCNCKSNRTVTARMRMAEAMSNVSRNAVCLLPITSEWNLLCRCCCLGGYK